MALRDALLRTYWAMQRRIAPTLRYSQELYEEELTGWVQGRRWLDLGCGHQVLPGWRLAAEQQLLAASRLVVGVDDDLPSLRHHRSIALRARGRIQALPVRSGSFDLATANMVLEHLSDPEAQLSEVNRVLAPGGLFVFHTPNRCGYATQLARLLPEALKLCLIGMLQGRKPEDVYPTHYRANTMRDIERLAQRTGFAVVRIRPIVSVAQFAVVLPLALLELLWIRLLMTRRMRAVRPNLIGVLRKTA